MADAAKTLIDKIDEGLEQYYIHFNRNDYKDEEGIGKFKAYAEEEGFDDNGVQDDLNQTDPDECMVIDFDADFPLKTQINDENKRAQEILRILKYICVNGSYPIKMVQSVKVDLETVNIPKEKVADSVKPYEQQMKIEGLDVDKNADLRYFLAVSTIRKYPFITYMVDSYTRDNAKTYAETKQVKEVGEWVANKPFMKKLKIKYPIIASNLKSAITTYSTRIMQRLTFTPTLGIVDNLKEICEYIAGVPAFIDKLIEHGPATPPFQIDLSIAVKEVKSSRSRAKQDKKEQDDDNDDDDDDVKNEYEEKRDPSFDYIGDVMASLRDFPVVYEDKNFRNYELAFERNLGNISKEFRTKLSEFNQKQKVDYVKIEYNPKTYPQNRRFAIFIDRRENHQNEDG
eukprot:396395_1